ncbi:MAG TPA: sugar O-acetyltransferase [Neisseria sp.]|nr:sugar O-acetyltransferase [Neisseria sp.]
MRCNMFSDGRSLMMNERDKMLAGLPHNPMDAALDAERERAKEWLHDYNVCTRPGDMVRRRELMATLLGKGGESAYIVQPFYCDYGRYIEVGSNFFANFNCTMLDAGLRNQAWEDAKPIVIGDNVWIGAGCTIVGGVTIGDNAVIAAGSVVTKNIPADMLAMGVPCRPVRKITEADRAAYQARIDEANV